MNKILIDLNISPDQYVRQYQRPGCVVNTRARDGRRVQFPANILKPFLLHSGIRGTFCIEFDAAGKFSGIRRVVYTGAVQILAVKK